MRNTVVAFVLGAVLGAVGVRLATPALLPSPESAPEADAEPQAAPLPDLPEPYYRVLFENDVVRVVEHVLERGQSEPRHTHPPMVAYFVSGARARITEPDGSSTEGSLPTGGFVERPEWWTHSLENVGDTRLHSILVEFKGRAGGS